MINTKRICATAILSLSLLSFGTAVHACRFHGEFGAQRFSPFQAQTYVNSSSWGASLNQSRQTTPLPKKQEPSAEPAEQTWNEEEAAAETEVLTSSDMEADRATFH